jgi:hypothetical protein
MEQTLQAQIETYRARLSALICRGLDVCTALANDPSNITTARNAREWQQDCGVTINELSGGSKAHWLARSFSDAFLVRASSGEAVEGVSPVEIVNRLLGVLERGLASLSRSDTAALIASSETPSPHRFDFVHNSQLRPVLERAYTDGRCALDEGDYDLALLSYCGILEAIVTDALEHKGLDTLTGDMPARRIADWSFDTRLRIAEKMDLIRGSCARLPAVARNYRGLADGTGEERCNSAISERDARLTGQVLQVLMRDLNPGR